MRIFICHTAEDKIITKLAAMIKNALVDPDVYWDDTPNEVDPTEWDHLLDRIEACEIFVYVLSTQSRVSRLCQAQYDYATALNKPLLPVLIENINLPVGTLSDTQYADLRRIDSQKAASSLTKGFGYLRSKIGHGDYEQIAIKVERPPCPVLKSQPSSLSAKPIGSIPQLAPWQIQARLRNFDSISRTDLANFVFELKQWCNSINPLRSKQAARMLYDLENDVLVPQDIRDEITTILNSIGYVRRMGRTRRQLVKSISPETMIWLIFLLGISFPTCASFGSLPFAIVANFMLAGLIYMARYTRYRV
jgi:hypothetical protein